ncbi:hypothetical protein AALO_G00091890, partial [Alosa alosa]
MDLAPPLSSGCNVTEALWGDLGLLVKEEDIKEEEYGHMIACPDEEEEKPFAELHCKTETDVTDSNYESLQTTVKMEVKIEEDEHDYLLESVSEHPHVMAQKIHGQSDELNLQLKGGLHHCSVCKKTFMTLRELEKHQQTHSVWVNENRSHKKTHTYSHCEKAFTTPSLVNHHLLTHTGEKSHKCAQCGNAFITSTDLKHHMLAHTGEKPRKCLKCGKGFSHSSSLSRHMLVHKGEKSHKRYHKCSQCGISFTTSQDLQNHMLTHSEEKPHKCTQCGKTFSQISNLYTHMRIHTGEKPHKCTQCGKAFITSTDVKRHMLIHTREKPY